MSRDFSIPLTVAEIEEIRATFRTMPTYNSEEDFMDQTDLPALLKAVGYFRAPEDYAVYQQYWVNNYNGIVPVEVYLNIMRNLADMGKFIRTVAVAYDKDGNGIFSADEFEELIKCMIVHNPKLETLSFEDFVKIADTNRDGQVDVQECVKWIESNLNYVTD